MAGTLNWSASFIKYILFFFNFIFVITGIILICVGLGVQGAFHGYHDVLDSGFYSVPSLLISIGSIIFLVAFFGCCGALRENYCMILSFSVLLIVIFILELSAGISGFVLRNQTTRLLHAKLNETMYLFDKNDTAVQRLWFEIQIDFECCGIIEPSDWNVALNNTDDGGLPTSCCKRAFNAIGSDICNVNTTDATHLHNVGCLTKFGDYVRDHAFSLGIAGIILASLQFIGIIFACFISKTIRENRWMNG